MNQMITRIMIASLLFLSVASREHIHKDAFQRCMYEQCEDEMIACDNNRECYPTIKKCGDQFKRDKIDRNFYYCLDQCDEAYNLMGCVIDNCSDEDFTQIVIKLDKIMN